MSLGIVKIIKSSPLFLELLDEEIDDFIKGCEVERFDPDEHIIREGTDGDEIHLILTGRAWVRRGDLSIAELGKGDILGELILLNQNSRTADVIASTPVDALVIEYDYIFKYFKKNPKLFAILMLNLSRMLAGRLKKAGTDLQSMALKNKELQAKLDELK